MTAQELAIWSMALGAIAAVALARPDRPDGAAHALPDKAWRIT
jgi:hypothetical protein